MFNKNFAKQLSVAALTAVMSFSTIACSFTGDSDVVPDEPVLAPVVDVVPDSEPEVKLVPYIEETEEGEEYFVFVGNEETGNGVEVSSIAPIADISKVKITDLDALKKQLVQLPNLVYIDMCDCDVSNEDMEDLMATFPNIRFVWKIYMNATNEYRTLYWSCRTDALAFSTLHAFATDPRLVNDDAQQFKYCTDLVAYDVGHNAVYDVNFLANMPNLHILIMVDDYDRVHHCKFNDLSPIAANTKLMYLEFFVSNVSDISFLQYMPYMTDLNISYSGVKDSTYLYDLPSIERLFMESTGIPYSEFEKLVDLYPDAQLEYYGTGSVDHGWRSHPRYFAMIDMYRNNYWNDLFRTEEELADVATYDMLVIGKKRYYGTSYTYSGEVTDDMIGGFISSRVENNTIPKQSGECNFDALGHAYTKDTGNGAILVMMEDGKYHWFYYNEVLARLLREKLDENGHTIEPSTLTEEEIFAPKPDPDEVAEEVSGDDESGDEASDDEVSDGDASDSEVSDGDASDGGVSDSEVSDGDASDGGVSDSDADSADGTDDGSDD